MRLCPGEKVVGRETALRRHPRALETIITHYPHLRFLSRMLHAHHEDDATRGQRRWRGVVTALSLHTGCAFFARWRPMCAYESDAWQ